MLSCHTFLSNCVNLSQPGFPPPWTMWFTYPLVNFQGPKYQEIVNIRLGDGSIRRGQVLEVDGEKAVV